MRFRAILGVAALAAIVVAGAVVADETATAEISGKIMHVENDGGFDVVQKGILYEVRLSGSTLVGLETPTTLDKIALGTTLHVLGLKQAEIPGTSKTKRRVPGNISQVRSIIVGDVFQEPGLDKDSAVRQLEWSAGALEVDGKGYTLGELQLHVEKNQPASVFVKADRAALTKDRVVIVDGTWIEGKAKGIAATHVRLVGGGGAIDEKTRIAGKIGDVTKDGFDLAVKDGAIQVTLTSTATPVIVHSVKALGDLPEGTVIHILAHKILAHTDSHTGAPVGPALYDVVAIVVGDAFVPLPLDKDQDVAKIVWDRGPLKKKPTMLQVNGYDLQAGRDRVVIVVDAGTRAALVKGKAVLIEGVRTGDAKSKQVSASRVDVLAPEVPADDYRQAFGL